MKQNSPRQSPRNFLARREQVRLLALVFTLGLVVILMVEAAKPKNWYWMWGGKPPQTSPASQDRPKPPDEYQDVDTRLRPTASDVEPTEPLIVAAGDSEAEDAWAAPQDVVYAEHLLPGVRKNDLEVIRDDTAFSSEENEVFYRWLVQCDRLGATKLSERSLGPTTHLQLFKQSDVYRGRVVSLRGTVRRALRVHANENPWGVDTYYQLWLQPDDRPSLPIVVYSMQLPEGFPVATEIKEEVTLVAVPYKRWPYLAQDTMRSAPLVLAPTVSWQVASPVASTEITATQLTLVVLGATAMAALVVTFIIKRTNQGRLRKQSKFAEAFQAVQLNADLEANSETAIAAAMQEVDETAEDDSHTMNVD